MRAFFWLCFAAATALYLAMVFVTMPTLMNMAGGLMPFDMRPGGYDLPAAQAYLAALGEEGRAYYLGTQHRLDSLFPGLMGLALVLGGFLMMRRPWLWVFVAVVIVAKAADYLENGAVAQMLEADEVTADMVMVASRWTLVKTVGDTLAYVTFLLAAGLAMWRWIKERQNR